MHEAMPPADDFEEELVRRNKEKERRVWDELAAKHLLYKSDSTKGLAVQLRLMLIWLSEDPKFRRDIPEDKFPIVLEIVNSFRRRVHRAQITLDWGFLRRLSEAAKLITKGEIPESLDLKLTFTGYGLIAWAHLRIELGHRPSEQQVRERVERLRKEDGETVRIGDRQWDRVRVDLRPLFRHGG
jgi:hypothetical protein